MFESVVVCSTTHSRYNVMPKSREELKGNQEYIRQMSNFHFGIDKYSFDIGISVVAMMLSTVVLGTSGRGTQS
jgi:aromatic ring hydroxylase